MYLFHVFPGFWDSSIEISKMFSTQIINDNTVNVSKICQKLKDVGPEVRKKAGETSKAAIIGDEMSAVLKSCFLFITSKFTINVKGFQYYIAIKYKKPFEMEILLIEVDSQE